MSTDTEATNYLRYLMSQGWFASSVEIVKGKLDSTVGQHMQRDAQNWIKTKLEEHKRYEIEETQTQEFADLLEEFKLAVVLVRNESPRYFAGLAPTSKRAVWSSDSFHAKLMEEDVFPSWQETLQKKGFHAFAIWAQEQKP